MEPRTITGLSRAAQLSIVMLALFLRLVIFPHRDETRGFDETGYLTGSLALLEGLPPGYKAAPAGPNTWVGWLYTGGIAAWHVLHPSPEERAVPAQVRPFIAVNHALFDHYRDLSQLHDVWIISQLLLTLLATLAAFRFGWHRAELAGGILIGGLFAVLPLYVDFTMMSRPYMTAWAFAMLSLDAATTRENGKRIFPAAVFLGLAVASRIEMLLFAPVVFWEFWFRPEPRRLLTVLMKFAGVSIATTLLAAPWLLTHLIGNLRTIATVRLSGSNLDGATTLWGFIKTLAWSQGLFDVILGSVLVLIGLSKPERFFSSGDDPAGRVARNKIAVLAVYIAFLFGSLAGGSVLPHQQGAVVLALITFTAFAALVANRIAPALAPWIAVLVLIPPLAQTSKLLHSSRQNYVPDGSVAWVESHVPPGTIVYLQPGMQNLLPTPESASALWGEVTDENAWRRKFEAGMERFGLTASQIPRALSEENLVQERGNRRGLFILGSRPNLPDPRYDIRLYNSSPVFGVHNLAAEFARTGGVVISQNTRGIPELGEPTTQWVSPSGVGSFIYCSPDVASQLKP